MFNNPKVQTLKFDLHPLGSGRADLECIRDNHVKALLLSSDEAHFKHVTARSDSMVEESGV